MSTSPNTLPDVERAILLKRERSILNAYRLFIIIPPIILIAFIIFAVVTGVDVVQVVGSALILLGTVGLFWYFSRHTRQRVHIIESDALEITQASGLLTIKGLVGNGIYGRGGGSYAVLLDGVMQPAVINEIQAAAIRSLLEQHVILEYVMASKQNRVVYTDDGKGFNFITMQPIA